MGNDNTKPMGRVIGIDECRIERHVSELVWGSVEKTLNELLDAEADTLCVAPMYSRSPDRVSVWCQPVARRCTPMRNCENMLL